MKEENKYLRLPFDRYDTEYLESLPNEVFFAKRFVMSEEDTELLMKNSGFINGHRFYLSKVLHPLNEKYAKMTNPKPGEPGTIENPLVRFGKEYIYNKEGHLVMLERESDIPPERLVKKVIYTK